MSRSFDEARQQTCSGELLPASVRDYVLDRGGTLTIATATMPGG